jgi:outer membrane protein assembly factor BamB
VEAGIGSSFEVVNGILYFTDEDGALYALNGKNGQLLWEYRLVESAFSKRCAFGSGNYSNPIVVDDHIYISAESTVYAFSISGALSTPSDLDAQVAIGHALWLQEDLQGAKSTLQAVVESKPNVIAAWTLLAEIFEGFGEKSDAIRSWQRVIVYASPQDEEYQKALQHLRELVGLRWRFKPYPTSSLYAGRATATKNNVYLKGREFLYVLERETGKLIEQHKDGDFFPYLAEGMVYVHYGSKLYALESQTDRVLWTYDYPPDFRYYNVYALEQTIFITGRILGGDGPYALSAESGELLWKLVGGGRCLAGYGGIICGTEGITKGGRIDGERVNAFSSGNGELLWTYEIRGHYPEQNSSASLNLASSLRPLAVSEETVYVAASTNDGRTP